MNVCQAAACTYSCQIIGNQNNVVVLFYGSISPYYLTITTYTGSNPLGVIKKTEIPSVGGIASYVHYATTQTVTFSVSPIQNPAPDCSDFVSFGEIQPGTFTITNNLINVACTAESLINGNFTYKVTIPPGYYLFYPDDDGEDGPLTFTWQTDPYPCPYVPLYPDVN